MNEGRETTPGFFKRVAYGQVIGLIVGACLTYLSLAWSFERQVALLIGAVGFVLGAILTDHYQIFKNLEEVNKTVAQTTSAVAALQGIHEIPELAPQVTTIISCLTKMKANNHSFLTEFSRLVVHSTADRFSRALATSEFKCVGEEELELTKALVKTCKKELNAVSFGDMPWWTGKHGQVYLQLHRELMAANKKIRITRIFIASAEDQEKLADVIRQHTDLGISTHVVLPTEINDLFERDFVLYDDVLREAKSLDDGSLEKVATFTIDRIKVENARREFDTLVSIAKSKGK